MVVLKGLGLLQKKALGGLILRARMGHYVSPQPWNYLWKPGPYPKTEEERVQAAKKYGLIPEDYKPFPEEEMMGDYPDLKPSSADSRSGLEYWDDPVYRRNFGEPLHANFYYQMETRYDDTTRPRYSLLKLNMIFLGWLLALLIPFYLMRDIHIGRPMTPRQLPYEYPNHVFYTFEPAEPKK